ncbi:PrsW family intramembrane metalloprotease [Patescibacteria group bacterium]|nr:MAG: PrsW family intramembrane metalloprotease [Patescibacteria group bacterium]
MFSFLMSTQSAFAAFFLSLIPVLIWLTFWLFEDSKRPEPRKLIFLAFVSGMVGVLIVLPFQQVAATYLTMSFPLILIWAGIEEVTKFLIAYVMILRKRDADEPIDFPIYLITVALGFAALENTLFIFNPLANGQIFEGLVSGNLRFIGATLVHVLSSSVIGGALAFAYYRERIQKIWYGVIGVILAILLHAFFNFLIIISGSGATLTVFLGVWFGIIFVLLALERIKSLARPLWWEKIFMRRRNQ